jgi:hypothetical protein
MRYWRPWLQETAALVNKSAKYIFATLIFSGLVLANLTLITLTVAFMKYLLT